MPRMDEARPESKLIKMLLIGDGKAGKSRLAGEAAAAGFKLLYLDGDVATPTLSMLPDAAKKNIYLLPAHDSISGGARDTRFASLIQEFTTVIKFKWNDTQCRLAKVSDKGDVIWEITPSLMDESCIFVLDSWTALVESIMLKAAIANSVNLADATMNEMRPVYQASANIATSLLQVIRSMPCHVIVIGHPDEYQHKVAPEGKRVGEAKEKDMLVDWTKMICKSTSRPHSLLMAKYFTDVAWLEVSPTGTRKLDFRVKPTRIGGGHFDGFEDTTQYSIPNLIKAIGGSVPGPDTSTDRWLRILTPEEADQPVESKVLSGGDTGKVGMSNIFGKKAATA
jgi:hypothetical protein